MGITVNIYDSGATRPSGTPSPDALTPLNAGESAALRPTETPDATALAQALDRAIDAGPPSAELVQAVEAGLTAAGATGTASSGSISAGAASA